MYCSENSFKGMEKLIKLPPNTIKNSAQLIQCLSTSLKELDLSANFVGKLEPNTFARFGNLQNLDLKHTNLEDFDFSILKNLKQLRRLDISQNHLKNVGNLTVFATLKQLNDLNMVENDLLNAYEIIEKMSVDMVDLKLSGNYVGRLSDTTFKQFPDIKYLYLSDTHLSFDNVAVFDPLVNLKILDISSNNLERASFIKSKIFNNLQFLFASNCKITQISQLINQLGQPLEWLEVSGSYWDAIEPTAFFRFPRLLRLKLSSMNLTYFDFNVLQKQRYLDVLSLSDNHLKRIDLTPMKGGFLNTLHLEGNDLTDIYGLTLERFPNLKLLRISGNRLSCEFLKSFDRELHGWSGLEIDDLWNQKHGEDCKGEKQQTTKSVQHTKLESVSLVPKIGHVPNTIVTIPTDSQHFTHRTDTSTEAPNTAQILIDGPTTILWIYIAIGISILCVIFIVIAGIFFRKKCLVSTTSNYYYEPRMAPPKMDNIKMSTVSKPLPKIPARVSFNTTDDNYYEEIRIDRDSYDHLQFSSPKPMPTFRP